MFEDGNKVKPPFEIKPHLIRKSILCPNNLAKNTYEIFRDRQKTIIDKQKHFASLNWQDNNLEHAHSQTIIGFF